MHPAGLLGLLSCQMCHDSSAVGGCGVLYDEVDGYVCGLAGRRSLLFPARSQTGCDQGLDGAAVPSERWLICLQGSFGGR